MLWTARSSSVLWTARSSSAVLWATRSSSTVLRDTRSGSTVLWTTLMLPRSRLRIFYVGIHRHKENISVCECFSDVFTIWDMHDKVWFRCGVVRTKVHNTAYRLRFGAWSLSSPANSIVGQATNVALSVNLRAIDTKQPHVPPRHPQCTAPSAKPGSHVGHTAASARHSLDQVYLRDSSKYEPSSVPWLVHHCCTSLAGQ